MKSLLKSELDALLSIARKHSADDFLLFSVIFNHGLRVTEACSLTRDNIVSGHIVVQRLKGSKKTTQPLLSDEREGLLEKAATVSGRFFLAEYKLTSSRVIVWRKIQAYGREAGIPEFKCHPHVLKHTTGRLGYEGGVGLPDIQAYLGHVNGKNTMIYLESTEEQAAKAFAAVVGK